jgi:hypothetical protein
LYALVIVSCLVSSMVTSPEGGGYLDSTLTIPNRTVFASQVECQAMVDRYAREGDVPVDQRGFASCISE